MVPRTYDVWVTNVWNSPYIHKTHGGLLSYNTYSFWELNDWRTCPSTQQKTNRETVLGKNGTTAGQWGTPVTSPAVYSQIITTRHNRSKQWCLNQSPHKLKIPNTEVRKLWASTVLSTSDAVCRWCSGLTHTSTVWSHHLTTWPWFMNMYTNTV